MKKYHDSHCEDKEVQVTIHRAVEANPELRNKKDLIETFIAGIHDVDDVMSEWRRFITEEKERQLDVIIQEERLKPEGMRKFIENAMRDGEVRTTESGIEKVLPPMGRLSGGENRAEKKKTEIERLKGFLDRFFWIG